VDRQCDSAQRLAEYLESRDDMVRAVYYPGLKSNPGHEIAKRQMKKFGAIIAFEINGGIETAKIFAEVSCIIIAQQAGCQLQGLLIVTERETIK
jgi:cystathionine beta-lyase/cystathionine gamma-synthase